MRRSNDAQGLGIFPPAWCSRRPLCNLRAAWREEWNQGPRVPSRISRLSVALRQFYSITHGIPYADCGPLLTNGSAAAFYYF